MLLEPGAPMALTPTPEGVLQNVRDKHGRKKRSSAVEAEWAWCKLLCPGVAPRISMRSTQ